MDEAGSVLVGSACETGVKRTPLRADPEKVREWLRKSRKPLARKTRLAPLGRRAARLRASEPDIGPLAPLEWRRAVYAACGGRCVMTGRLLSAWGDSWSWHAHHCVPKHKLPPDRRYDPRNGVLLARTAHEDHTSRKRTVPLDRLPASVLEFAVELGDWAVLALEREHPLGWPDGQT